MATTSSKIQNVLTPVAPPLSIERMVYDSLKEAILSFHFLPGSTIVEVDVARQLKISKTPVREALTQLEREGLIDKVPFRGYYVSEMSHARMQNLFDIQSALEGLAMRRAASQITADELSEAAEVKEEYASAVRSNNLILLTLFNNNYHDILIKSARNDSLFQLLLNMRDHLHRYHALSNYMPGRTIKSLVEHEEIFTAIKNHDEDAAESAVKKHIASVAGDLSGEEFKNLIARKNQSPA